MLKEIPSAFIYMKIGPHAGESLAQILSRKNKAVEESQRAHWGYGGSLCHPKHVIPFALQCTAENLSLYVLFQETTSRTDPKLQPVTLSNGEQILGSKYALVIGKIERVDLKLDLARYRVAAGGEKGKGQSAASFLKNQRDKACLVVDPSSSLSTHFINITYAAPLLAPYAIVV